MKLTINVKDFDLARTLDSGQVFGFTKKEPGFYEGVIAGKRVKLSQKLELLQAETISSHSNGFRRKLRHYFDLDSDLQPIYEILFHEKAFENCLKDVWGLRIIRQDSWEALACFIISSNNNVKRIQGIWRNLSSRLSHDKNSFPIPIEVARTHERILRELGLGYRAPYLLRTAQFVSANPGSLEGIRAAGYEEAKRKLLAFPGIGEKVADCVLLYGFQKYEAFPVDVWILRVMRKLFFNHRNVSEKQVHRFGQKRWGKHAGYVQQYLFHSARLGLL